MSTCVRRPVGLRRAKIADLIHSHITENVLEITSGYLSLRFRCNNGNDVPNRGLTPKIRARASFTMLLRNRITMGPCKPFLEGLAMDRFSSSACKIASRGTKATLRYSLAVLATTLMVGCSGSPSGSPTVTQTQGPSGIITVTPASSSAAPITIPVDNSQTFMVSEIGYGGSFSFGGSKTNEYNGKSSTVKFSAPAGVSVELTKTSGCFFGHCFTNGLSYTVLVTDSLGNGTTIYTN